MSGTLEVNYIPHHKICVTWKIGKCYADNDNYTSPQFSLIVEEHSITFSLSAHCYYNFEVNVKQGTAIVGRSIVTIAVKVANIVKMAKSSLKSNWQRDCTFQNCIELLDRNSPKDLSIDCDITWLGFVDEIEARHCQIALLPTPNRLFTDKALSDVKIIVGSQEILTHKAIVALHSPVLLAMFETPMRESKENCVTIEDVDFSTMETLLQMLYTGEAKDLSDVNKALKVLAAAEKYQMSTVKSTCEYKLQLLITAENVLTLLKEADMYKAHNLSQRCIEYIIAKREKIISREDFQKLCLEQPNISTALIQSQMKMLYMIPITED